MTARLVVEGATVTYRQPGRGVLTAVDAVDLEVGAGEVGPYGSSRTRFEMEVDERLSAAGVAELAWVTGMITWEQDPEPGWYDAESGDLVPEAELADKYHDAVVAKCGIREFSDDGDMIDSTAPLLVSVFLPDDMSFVVDSEAQARAFVDAVAVVGRPDLRTGE